MIRHHSTRLMYRRYTHQLVFSGDAGQAVLDWASAEMPREFRRHTKRRVDGGMTSVTLFCNGRAFSRILDGCGHQPISVRMPVDDRAENLLLNNIQIVIRDKPYWGRYRFAMHFWAKHGDGNADGNLMRFVASKLGPAVDGCYRLMRSRYFPSVYLSDESQLAMLRMSEPPDRVIGTVVVYTQDEVRDTIR